MFERISQNDNFTAIKFLRRLADKEKRESIENNHQPVLYESRKELLTWFKTTERFKEMYSEARSFLGSAHSDSELERNRSRFAGNLFELLAYHYLAGIQPQSSSVLSPRRTLEFYRLLFPQDRIASHPYRKFSIYNQSVPDGLVVEKEKGKDETCVRAIAEYTLAGGDKGLNDKYKSFLEIRKKFPGLFGQTNLIFVIPKIDVPPFVAGYSEVQIIQLPFTHKQFRDYVDGIYKHYEPDGESVTLSDIQELARDKLKKRVELMGGDIYGIIYYLPGNSSITVVSYNSESPDE